MAANQVVPFEEQKVPAHITRAFGTNVANNELVVQSVSGNKISFRGKLWRMIVDGEEKVVTRDDGETASSIEVVMLLANPHRSKAWYAKKYVEGEDSSPTCGSKNGIAPDAGVEDPQSDTCALCPHNVWGSRISDSGKKAKECSDSKRMAVLPANDLTFHPLLLQIPATSLSGGKDDKELNTKKWFSLSEYGQYLSSMGAHYSGVVTKIGFDPRPAHPRLVFKAVRYLYAEELGQVQLAAASKEVADIIGVEFDVTVAANVAKDVTEDGPAAAAPVAEKKTRKTAEKKETKPAAAAMPDDDDPVTLDNDSGKVVSDAPDALADKVADILGSLDD